MNCLKVFEYEWYKTWPERKYCSKSCSNQSTLNGKKLKGIYRDTTHLSPFQFKKNSKPWNKSLKGYSLNIKNPRQFTDADRNRIVEWRKKNGWDKGENHPQWKGEDVKYQSLHIWVRRQKGDASECWNEHCEGLSNSFDWANIDGEYRRNLDDFISLCRSCHKLYDNSMEHI